MNSNSKKDFRVFVQVLTDSEVTSEGISYRSSFTSCIKYVSLCLCNLFPRHCHVRYYIQRRDPLSDSYITISSTYYTNSDLPF